MRSNTVQCALLRSDQAARLNYSLRCSHPLMNLFNSLTSLCLRLIHALFSPAANARTVSFKVERGFFMCTCIHTDTDLPGQLGGNQ